MKAKTFKEKKCILNDHIVGTVATLGCVSYTYISTHTHNNNELYIYIVHVHNISKVLTIQTKEADGEMKNGKYRGWGRTVSKDFH